MTINELKILKTTEARQIIADNLTKDPSVFALKNGHPAAATLATQLKYLQRSRAKLPTFYTAEAIIPPLAFEQCSSEKAASAKDFSGEKCLDLTCGLGVDSLHFAKSFQHVTSIERNAVLAETVHYNFGLMNIKNINVVNTTAEDFVNNYTGAPFDLIYLDPARRDGGGKKVFLPEDCEPNFVALLPILLKIGRKIVVKMSPMYDVDAAFRQFENVSEVGVISVDNECKEVLLIFENSDLIKPLNPSIFIKCFYKNQFFIFKKELNKNTGLAINYQGFIHQNELIKKNRKNDLNVDNQLVINDSEINLDNKNNLINSKKIIKKNNDFELNNELKTQLNNPLNSELKTRFNYLIEPDVAFYKARFFEKGSPQYMDEKSTILTASNGFFLSNSIDNLHDFPSRIFQIEQTFNYQPKRISAFLKSEKINALNVVQRNFPFSAADIRAALKVKEGGDWFLICTLFQGEKWAFLAKRLEH
jgi:16S rRNA G966 N2-methylase RsmD